MLVKVGVDVLVLDSAYGYLVNILYILEEIKKSLVVDVIVGNVVIKEVISDLISVGVDVIKVGIGLGSICIIRIVVGVGMF